MFVVFKKIYLFLAVVFCIMGVTLPVVTSLALNEIQKETVVIDPGHGGYDGGVKGVTSGVSEATVNLEIAKLLKGYFESDGKKVILTRTADVALTSSTRKQEDMRARIRIINRANPKLLISLHVNYYTSSSRRGIQVFYGKKTDEKLAEQIQKEINSALNYPEIGRNYQALWGDYYLLANAECPSALIECGFFSNPQDEALLLDENYRMRLAYEIFSAVKKIDL